jgi:hypothetical protein
MDIDCFARVILRARMKACGPSGLPQAHALSLLREVGAIHFPGLKGLKYAGSHTKNTFAWAQQRKPPLLIAVCHGEISPSLYYINHYYAVKVLFPSPSIPPP